MCDADVKVMPRRADGRVMSCKETSGESNRTFPVCACVRMRMLSIYLFNQFSTLIVVLSFGPSVKSTLGSASALRSNAAGRKRVAACSRRIEMAENPQVRPFVRPLCGRAADGHLTNTGIHGTHWTPVFNV